MDHRVIDKASEVEYITKLLELLLKCRHEWSEKDDVNSAECKSRFLLEYYEEFEERFTLDDIQLQMTIIRELYKKEASKLIKSGKRGNESNLSWFYKAESLFFHTIDWGKEILKDKIISSVSVDDSTVKASDVALANLQCEPLKLPSLLPAQMLSSSQIPMFTSMAPMTSVSSAATTSLPYSIHPISVDSSKPYAVKQLLTTTAAFSNINSALRTTKSFTGISKRHVLKTPEFLTVSSPFVMNVHSSKVHHPGVLIQPTSPATLIPLWLTTASPTVSLKPNTIFTSAEIRLTPAAISTIGGVNFLSTAVSSIELSSTTPRSEVPQYLIDTPWTTQGHCSTTLTYSLAKDPIFTTTVSSMDQLSLTSETLELSLSTMVSSSRTRIPILQTVLSPRIDTVGSVAPLSRAGLPLWPSKPPPPYTTSVHLPLTATSSRSNVLTSVSPLQLEALKLVAPSSSTSNLASAAPLSKGGQPLWLYNPPPPCTTSIHLPLTSTSSRSNVHTSVFPLQLGVIKSVAPSSSTCILTSDAPPSKGGHPLLPYKHPPPYTRIRLPLTATSSRSNALTSVSPLQLEALKLVAPSSSTSNHASADPLSKGGQPLWLYNPPPLSTTSIPLPLTATSSRSNVLTSVSPSLQLGALKSVAPSSSTGILTLTALPSRTGHPLWPRKPPPPYTTTNVHFSTAATYSSGVLTSASSSSRIEAVKTTATSSTEGLLVLSYNPKFAYSQRVPPSSTALSYMSRVPLSQNSPSSTVDALTPAAPSSRTNVLNPPAPYLIDSNLTPATTFPSGSVLRSYIPSLQTEVSFSQATPTSLTGVPLLPTIPSYRNEAHLLPTASSSTSESFPLSTSSYPDIRVSPSPNTSRFKAGASLITPISRTSSNVAQRERLI